MIVSKIASAIYNDIQGGLAGYEATLNMSLEQLEDEVVEERLAIIKLYSQQNMIPRKDLLYSLNCIEVGCEYMDKCCSTPKFGKKAAHFEIPQIVNDFGDSAIEYIGSTDKSESFKVYTSENYKYHKYKTRGKDKPYVYIDTTPNKNNMYDCYLFNAPMLLRVSVTAIFKDPRQVEKYSCCPFTELDNFTFIATEVKKNLITKKLNYYRGPQYPILKLNDQVPK